MQNVLRAFSLALISVVGLGGIVGAQNPSPASPAWAYGFPPLADDQPGVSGIPPPPRRRRLRRTRRSSAFPAARKEFTLAHIRDYWDVGDWFPDDHPPMPAVVVHGRQPHVRGCAMCHMPNGKGRPENAPVAGQPVRLHRAAAHGLQERPARERRSAQGEHGADDRSGEGHDRRRDRKQAATYFSSMKWTPWITVRETATVPKTRLAGNVFLPLAGRRDRADRQPHHRSAGGRGALRASRSAVGLHRLRAAREPERGAALVASGGGKTIAVRRLSRRRLERPRPGAGHRRADRRATSCASSGTSSRARARARGRR